MALYNPNMKPRIAILIPRHGLGGVEHVMKQLCAALNAASVETELLTLESFRTPTSTLRISSTAFRLAQHLRHHQFNTLISAKEEANSITALIKSTLLPSLNTMITRHVPVTDVGGDSRWYVPHLYRQVYRRVDHIVAVSDEIAATLRTIVGPHRAMRVHSLPNAVIGPNFEARSNESIHHPWLEQSTPVLVTVGRLAKQKNLGLLVDSLGCLPKDSRPRWLIIGDGPQRSALQRRIQQRSLDSITQFLGTLDNPLPWMKAADIVALPSLYEGLPTVLIEALAVGTPCVATDCKTGPRQLAASGGALHLVDNASAISFANGIQQMRNNPSPTRPFDRTPYTHESAAQGVLSILNGRQTG